LLALEMVERKERNAQTAASNNSGWADKPIFRLSCSNSRPSLSLSPPEIIIYPTKKKKMDARSVVDILFSAPAAI